MRNRTDSRLTADRTGPKTARLIFTAATLRRCALLVLFWVMNPNLSWAANEEAVPDASKPVVTPVPGKLALMMVEQCRVNNTDLLNPVMLENSLKNASNESWYFDLKPLPSQLRQLVQVNPDLIDWSKMGDPDFLLLNCDLGKSTDRYDLTINLRSTDEKAPLDMTIDASQPVSDNASSDARKLMEKLWRKIDLPMSVIADGVDLSGLWYDEADGRLIQVKQDKPSETVHLSVPRNRITNSPIFRGPATEGVRPDLPWHRMYGSFDAGELQLKDEAMNVQLTGQYLEELADRVLELSGKRADGTGFQQRLKAIQPEMDDVGFWQMNDGQWLKMTKSSVSPGRYTVKYFHDTPKNAPWSKAEILLDGTRVYARFMKKSGTGFRLVERKEGELYWATPWHDWMTTDPALQEIRFEDGVWKFVNPA